MRFNMILQCMCLFSFTLQGKLHAITLFNEKLQLPRQMLLLEWLPTEPMLQGRTAPVKSPHFRTRIG